MDAFEAEWDNGTIVGATRSFLAAQTRAMVRRWKMTETQ